MIVCFVHCLFEYTSFFAELDLLFASLQADEDCCNSCEDVREAYRKKGWAVSNPDLIDQV